MSAFGSIALCTSVGANGVGLAVLWRDMVPLVVIAALALPLAAWLFRHRLV